ncbi:MAG: sigma-70 family RNA polymerase sigma factor [Candidatus Aminicenantes bacterium]|nr:sigma-70 family RNA polymerase sigma factor [Candidatus Aminicenantes bacterium]
MSNSVKEPMDDRAEDLLVDLTGDGRTEAFLELVRRFQERIHRTIYGMTRNLQDADDLTQETFLAAYRALPGFERRSSFYTWLYRIAVNLTLNHLKKRGREKNRDTFEDNVAVLEKAEYDVRSPEGDSLRRELEEKINEAVAALPPLYEATFQLVAVEGLSHGQAGELLGCSENTVSWRMHKARKMLQAALGPYFSEVGHGV